MHRAAVCDDRVLDDGEAEACAAEFAGASFIYAIETFEDTLEMLRLDAAAVVRDREGVAAAADVLAVRAVRGDVSACDTDVRGALGIGDAVVDDVAEDAIDKAAVARHDGMLGKVDAGCYATLAELQRGVCQHTLHDGGDIDILARVALAALRQAFAQLIEFRQCRHVEQQAVHALALGIAAFKKLASFLFQHLGMVDDALEIAVYAGGGCLQLMGGVLRELALDECLLLFAVPQLPVERDDVVRDVAQLVVGQTLLYLMVDLLALFCLPRKLFQYADVAADALCAAIEHDAEKQGDGYDGEDVGVIHGERAGELCRVGYGGAYDD